MKNIWILLVVLFSCSACYKDLGDYDYREIPEGTISGIDEKYSEIAFDTLKILPEIATVNGTSDYSCRWMLLKPDEKIKDTIGCEQRLNWVVNRKTGIYQLLFSATSLTTGVEIRKRMELTVTSSTSVGWYVLKNAGEKCDIDYFSNDSVLTAYDMLSGMYGYRLEGKGKRLAWFDNFWELNENGRYSPTKRLFVQSAKETVVFDPGEGEVVRKMDELFYQVPGKKDFQRIFLLNRRIYILNDGLLTMINASSSNTGRFGTAIPLSTTDVSQKYKLSEYTVGYSSYGPLVWDEITNSFMYVLSTGKKMGVFKDKTGKISVNNMDYKLLFMGTRFLGAVSQGCALMKKKGENDYRILMLNVKRTDLGGADDYPVTLEYKVNPDAGLLKAGIRTACPVVDGIYYVEDNKLKLFRCNDDEGEVVDPESALQGQAFVPVGEELVFLQTDSYNFGTKQLVWGTRKGENYIVRIWSLTNNGLLDKEIRTLTGSGEPVQVKNVSNSVVNMNN